jgi:hypothetical protein
MELQCATLVHLNFALIFQQVRGALKIFVTSVWTAQTTLASSYGFFQVMYVTAIDRPLIWRPGNLKNRSLFV